MSTGPDDHRRKWDRKEYEEKAQDRIRPEKDDESASTSDEPPIARVLLKRREFKVDLDSKLGKSIVIRKQTPSNRAGGYYCNICDCVLKDSDNFLEHLNGKKHQRNLGMSMNIKRSSVAQVLERFQQNKKKMEEKEKDYKLDVKVREAKEEEDRYKIYKKEKKSERKRKADDDLDGEPLPGMPSEMAAVMGFGGFGGAKKNN